MGYDTRELTQQGGGQTEICPFDLLLSTDEDGNPTVSVWPGTVGGVLIDNYNEGLPIEDTGTQYIQMTATTNGKYIQSAKVEIVDSQPDAQEPTQDSAPNDLKVLIGIIVNGEAFKIWGCSNMIGVPMVAYHTDKNSVEPGESPFNYFYVWNL